MKNLLTALFFVITSITYSQTPITDYNFAEAIKTCLTMSHGDGMCSSSEYGAMPDWDVSNVTNMKNAFNLFDTKKNKNIESENIVIEFLTIVKNNNNLTAHELIDKIISENNIKIRGFWTTLLNDLVREFYIIFDRNDKGIACDNSCYKNASVKLLRKGIDYLLDPCSFNIDNLSFFHNVKKTNLLKYKLNFNADISKWNVSNVESMAGMFFGQDSFKQDLSNWDVSKVTDMSYMFKGFAPHDGYVYWEKKYSRNLGDIGRWDTSNVTNMKGMFLSSFFDQDINNWDVSNVIDMSYMFAGSNFNQNLNNWDVSNVENMSSMFAETFNFNQDISNWDVSRVEDMSLMFYSAHKFNQNLNSWNVSNVKKMRKMFSGTLKIITDDFNFNDNEYFGFNQDLGNWDVSNVIDMTGMFEKSNFNKDIGNWDVSNVKNMNDMFNRAIFFNQDISSWEVSNVFNMRGMFKFAVNFNQNIGNWDVSNVINMNQLFYFDKTIFNKPVIINPDLEGLTFNQDISNWNVSNVINMSNMFYGASSFNQDLGRWNVNNVKTAYNFFNDKNSQWNQNKPKFNNLIKFYKVSSSIPVYGFNYVYLPQSMSCSNKDYEDSVIKSSDNYSGIEEYSIGDSVNFKLTDENNFCFGDVFSGIIIDIGYTNVETGFQTLDQLNNDTLISMFVLTNDVVSNDSNYSQKCYSPNKIKDIK